MFLSYFFENYLINTIINLVKKSIKILFIKILSDILDIFLFFVDRFSLLFVYRLVFNKIFYLF